jgi:hypothetical protein
MASLTTTLGRINPAVAARIERGLRRVPFVRNLLEQQYSDIVGGLDASLHPYRGRLTSYPRLPETGRSRSDILAEMRALQAEEQRAGATATSPARSTMATPATSTSSTRSMRSTRRATRSTSTSGRAL